MSLSQALLTRWVELSTDEFGVINAQGTAAAAGGVDENPAPASFSSSSSNAPAPGTYSNLPDTFSDSEDEAARVLSSDQHAQVLKFYSTTSNAATAGFSKLQKQATHKDYSNSSRMEHALTRFAWNEQSVSDVKQLFECV
jgi:hypothetical protein